MKNYSQEMWSKLGTWPAGQKNKYNNHIRKHITEVTKHTIT
jgi:hypothetical protein